MQLSIMLFFQSIRTPLVEKAAEVASMFGEIAIPLLVEIILLWCFSRKKAFALASSLLSALLASQTLKAIFRVPRPFQVHPDLIEGGRLSTATGYSFPSGHSTTSGACYSSIAMIAWKRWATVICLVPIILVPISRLVLGVHWPSDVAAGTAIGVLFGCALTPLMLRLYDRRRPFLIFTFAFGMASTVLAIVLAFLIADGADPVAFDDLMGSAAISGGAMLGFYLERKTVDSVPESGSALRKIFRFIIGLVLTAAFAFIVYSIPAPEEFTSFALYFGTGLWCVYIYPLIAVRTGLMARNQSRLG